MQRSGVILCAVLVAVVLLVLAGPTTAASGKKPPFNGSIFGKRSYIAELRDYEWTGRSLTAMCEIASEACAAWFPQADKR